MSSRDTSPSSFVSSQIAELSRIANTTSTTPTASTTSNTTSTTTDDNKIKQEPEKKPVKKRKSWGQQLPTPTTNLAPRKRAKTAEEKEQRRVERVLRNRAAAQKSREVKKQQLEKIEQERDVLKEQNEVLLATNKQLEQLKQQLLEHTRRLEEENRRLRSSSTETDETTNSVLNEPNIGFTVSSAFLDPTDLITNYESIPTDGSITFPNMTHQPAALMCDLPCLRGILMKIFLPVLLNMMVFVEAIFSTFWTNLPTSIQVSLLPLNPPQYTLLTQFWKILSIAQETILQCVTSRVCSSVLAHLRIATDYSSPLTSSTEKVSVVFNKSFDIGFRKVARRKMGRLLGSWIQLGRNRLWGTMNYHRVVPSN
jgi:hypothetical protein